MDNFIDEIRELKELIIKNHLTQKPALTLREAAQHLELSTSYLYQLVSQGAIPVSKPNGKKLYFSRKDLDDWMLSNKQKSREEIEETATKFLTKKRA